MACKEDYSKNPRGRSWLDVYGNNVVGCQGDEVGKGCNCLQSRPWTPFSRRETLSEDELVHWAKFVRQLGVLDHVEEHLLVPCQVALWALLIIKVMQ